MTRNTTTSPARNNIKVRFARSSGTRSGTETTCAAITSPSFQPKPLSGPYNSTIETGAADGTEWQVRHCLSPARIGRDTDKIGPAGEVRSVTSFLRLESLRNVPTMSASHGCALSAGLVGF